MFVALIAAYYLATFAYALSLQKLCRPKPDAAARKQSEKFPKRSPPNGGGSGIPLPRRFSSKEAAHNGGAGDTLKTYCTEDTPAVLSHAGSHSDLSVLSTPNDKKNRNVSKDYTSDDSSNLSGDNENILAECIQSGMPKPKPKHLPAKQSLFANGTTPEKGDRKVPYLTAKDEVEKFAVENSPAHFSLRSSLSDLTVDGSIAGLASMKPRAETSRLSQPAAPPLPPQQSELSGRESLSSLSVDSVGSVEDEQALLEQCISSGMPKASAAAGAAAGASAGAASVSAAGPKNAPAASAAASTRPPPASGGGGNSAGRPAPPARTAAAGVSDAGSARTAGRPPPARSGCDAVEAGSKINDRMLDPDAMIESLDRFTAELVLQAQSRMEKDKDLTASSSVIEPDDTWTDTGSTNDVSFPSMSASIPQVITFSSDERKPQPPTATTTEPSSDRDTSALTASTLIAMEATRIATTFRMEAAMDASSGPFDLDSMQPPSHMNSMTNSIQEPKRSPKLAVRKKSLPNLMIRKALSNSLNQATSLESLENHSISNIDHVNPPSLMAEIDLLDFDGSMTSVASLQSEVADVKADFLVNGVVSESRHKDDHHHPMFNLKVPYGCSEIENMNPPSIFNELTDLSDVPAETTGSETEIFEDCRTQSDNDTSELGSNESTPKKHRRRVPTPKERRNISKERYKTYTIDLPEASEIPSKMTAREKRLSNRSRFETQVIDEATTNEALRIVDSSTPSSTVTLTASIESLTFGTITISSASIPTLTSMNITESGSNGSENTQVSSSPSKLKVRRNFMQKRLENKDRFKTKVISEPNSPELNYLLQKEAHAVLSTLTQTKSKVDELLDCETLSLVSNEEDSENNSAGSNYRTYHKSWGCGPRTPNIENPEEICENEADKPKPKIVKPEEVPKNTNEDEEKAKAIRGHRKTLYHRPMVAKTPITSPTPTNKFSSNRNGVQKSIPKPLGNPSKLAKPKPIPIKSSTAVAQKKQSSDPPSLERQGTFVKEESTSAKPRPPSGIPKSSATKIPSSSAIPKPSKIARAAPSPKPSKTFSRSPSADATKRLGTLQPSSSSQSLKNGAVKRSSVPESKQITSKIASLWKKVEETKKQSGKTVDKRIWIQPDSSKMIRSNTFDNKEQLRDAQDPGSKRVSRLGSFAIVDGESPVIESVNRPAEVTY